ncbi:MAG: 50S ribosomal protein L16, partial [Chloroflexi bacterium]|nr:50S ribosomal protein L16 [Chloroflexota bacterium]
MLQPKRVKYRKQFRGKRRGTAWSGHTLMVGEYGLKAMESQWITARQIEAARRAITHHVKRDGNLVIRVFPDKPVTKKPLETRMGSGKGAVEFWVASVKRGRILFELTGVQEDIARQAMRLAAS